MAEEKKTTSSSRPKKLKLSKDVRNSSNLRRSSRKLAHQFDFSNTVDHPIEIKEVEDSSEDREQGWSAYGVEASSEDDSQDTSSAPDKIETAEGLDERPPPLEKASMSILLGLLLLRFILYLHFPPIFFFSFALYFPFCRFHRDQLSI